MKFSESTPPSSLPTKGFSRRGGRTGLQTARTGEKLELRMGDVQRLPTDDRALQLRPSRTLECPHVPFRDMATLETSVTFSKPKNHASSEEMNRRVVEESEPQSILLP